MCLWRTFLAPFSPLSVALLVARLVNKLTEDDKVKDFEAGAKEIAEEVWG